MADLNYIVLAQINPTLGDMDGNARLILDVAHDHPSADLIITPELSLTGYSPLDLLDSPHFAVSLQTALEKFLLETTHFPKTYFIIGAPTHNYSAGKPWHNSLLLIRNGQIYWTYHKQLLPTYGIFSEYRHFEPGTSSAPVFMIHGVRVGLLICEDAWNYKQTHYPTDPVSQLIQQHPELIISINASPSQLGKQPQRHQTINNITSNIPGIPLIYVNHVGGHDEIISDGDSFISLNGHIYFNAPSFQTDSTLITLSNLFSYSPPASPRLTTAPAYAPLAPILPQKTLSTSEQAYSHIILGLRDYARRCGFTKVLVGCSGGIDSAITLALAVIALGPQNVLAVTMPSDFSSEGSVSDSVQLCLNLGIPLHTLPIAPIVNTFQTGFALPSSMNTPLSGVALENLQARIRGTALMAYSNAHGYLLLTTGNKSESAVGYCTLYGDTNGGLNLIGDLYKTEVFALACYINSLFTNLIPEPIISKPPSAELAPGQRDSDSLPEYPILDNILRYLLEFDFFSPEEQQQLLQNLNSVPNILTLVIFISRLVYKNEYKRRQMAPTLRIHPRSFGSGRRIPLSAAPHLSLANPLLLSHFPQN